MKKYIWIIIITTIACGLYFFPKALKKSHEIGLFNETLRQLHTCLILYTHNHNGRFPNSQQQLIDEGYFRIEKSQNKYSGKEQTFYHFPTLGLYVKLPGLLSYYNPKDDNPNNSIYWSTISDNWLEKIRINYGVQLDDLKLKWPMRLVSKKTDKQVLLIKGESISKGSCAVLSYLLYETMRKQSPEKLCKIAGEIKQDRETRSLIARIWLILIIVAGIFIKLSSRNLLVIAFVSSLFYILLHINEMPYWYPGILGHIVFTIAIYSITAIVAGKLKNKLTKELKGAVL